MTPAELSAPAIASLHGLLKPLGYRKTGTVFSRKSVDVVHLIELQGSRTNVSNDARFTINAGVFAPAVVYEDIREETKPSIAASHWRERIGFLGPVQSDVWWSVTCADLISKMIQLTAGVAHVVSHLSTIMTRLIKEIEHGAEQDSVPEGPVVAGVL